MTTTRKVDYTEYATRIVRAILEGVLLTTRAQDRLDTMTIGWGALGTNWSVPVFEAFVRTGRHTARMLEENPEFTVNVPLDEGKEARRRTRKAVGICGTHHGDECDKFEMAALTPVPSCEVSVPGILELPLTLECRVICKQALDVSLLPEELRARFYPADVDGSACGSNRDPHLMVFGRIVGAYVAEA